MTSDPAPLGRSRRVLRPAVLVPVGLVVTMALIAGLALFQPWKIWVDDVVDEALPIGSSAQVSGSPTATPSRAPTASAPASRRASAQVTPTSAAVVPKTTSTPKQPKQPKPATDEPEPPPKPAAEPATTVLANGSFISHEHSTRGTVRVLRLADGSRVLRIENLNTSNGPDLRVWITDAPVKPGKAGWFVFDDGKYVALGRLKGNIGNQNYRIPASVDLDELTSVSIWCDRFNVSFGAAALR